MNKKDIKSLIDILSNVDGKEALRIKKKLEKEAKPISVRSRKAKGRDLQKYVAQRISDMTGIPCGKDELIESREMGQSGKDIKLIGPAKDVFEFDIECKNVESFSIYKTMEQAIANTDEGRSWLIVWKKNGIKPVAILDFEKFLEIYFKPS